MINYLNKIFTKIGFKLTLTNAKSAILKDVYQSGFQKAVLVSYLKAPFLTGIDYSHSNYTECKTAADLFHELGYRVDVIDYTVNDYHIDYSVYEVVYGLGFPLERSFYSADAEKLIKIFYSTGCNPFYSYQQSALRVSEFARQKGLIIPQSSRISDFFWTFQYLNSDLIIALGNDFVANTYRNTNPNLKICPINAFYFDIYDIDLNQKNFSSASKNFLWFGSSGLLHKGLDIVIDFFAERPDVTLHICGASRNEQKFFEYYAPIIENCPNIVDHGFVDIKSEKFTTIMDTCGSVVFPSASEGGAVALLNVVANGGLIPILSNAAGLDLKPFNFPIADFATNLSVAVDHLLGLTPEEFKELANTSKKSVRENYSYQMYKQSLKEILNQNLVKVK